MKPEEAILMMRNRIDTASEIAGKGTDGKAFEDMEMAIEALKEIQQYREIGTVEEVEQNARDLKRQIEHSERLAEVLKATQNLLEKRERLLKEYCKIGTVEECREAVEKQKPKEPTVLKQQHSDFYNCPKCGRNLILKCGTDWFGGQHYKSCPNCGQAIQWDEDLEETEDEL